MYIDGIAYGTVHTLKLSDRLVVLRFVCSWVGNFSVPEEVLNRTQRFVRRAFRTLPLLMSAAGEMLVVSTTHVQAAYFTILSVSFVLIIPSQRRNNMEGGELDFPTAALPSSNPLRDDL